MERRLFWMIWRAPSNQLKGIKNRTEVSLKEEEILPVDHTPARAPASQPTDLKLAYPALNHVSQVLAVNPFIYIIYVNIYYIYMIY